MGQWQRVVGCMVNAPSQGLVLTVLTLLSPLQTKVWVTLPVYNNTGQGYALASWPELTSYNVVLLSCMKDETGTKESGS